MSQEMVPWRKVQAGDTLALPGSWFSEDLAGFRYQVKVLAVEDDGTNGGGCYVVHTNGRTWLTGKDRVLRVGSHPAVGAGTPAVEGPDGRLEVSSPSLPVGSLSPEKLAELREQANAPARPRMVQRPDLVAPDGVIVGRDTLNALLDAYSDLVILTQRELPASPLSCRGRADAMSGEREEMTTYSDPGGELIGDFSFVTGLEWFEDDEDPLPLRRQRWICVEDDEGVFYPSSPTLCPDCRGEGELDGGAICERCEGSGDHPLRGAGFVPAPPSVGDAP